MLKKSKIIFAFMLALLICLTSVSTALASNLVDGGALIGDEENPVQAAITKNFRLPEMTTIPNVNFNFLVTPKTVDGVDFNPDSPNMPRIGAETDTLGTGKFTLSFSSDDEDLKEPAEGLVNAFSIQKETPNIFAGIKFPHAGIFEYTVTEEPNTNERIDNPENVNEWLSYSPAVYTLTVYVANSEDGESTYVHSLGTLVTTTNPGQPGGDKVDPTPGGYEEEYRFSQIMFINDYVRNQGPVNPINASTLSISKTVTGDFGSHDLDFSFSISLEIPSIVPDIPEYYRAYIRYADGTVSDDYIEVSTSEATTFTLKHGQKLVFIDTPVGTSYRVTETGTQHYFPSLSVITNGVKVDYEELKIGEAFISEQQFVGELANSADFTNRRDTVTPTGLNLSTLPFIILIALGLCALIAFIGIKMRKRARYY